MALAAFLRLTAGTGARDPGAAIDAAVTGAYELGRVEARSPPGRTDRRHPPSGIRDDTRRRSPMALQLDGEVLDEAGAERGEGSGGHRQLQRP
jgi:hypothetical protein